MIGKCIIKLENTHILELTPIKCAEDYKINSSLFKNIDFSILEKELNGGKTITIESTLFILVDIIQHIENGYFENIELHKI